MAKRSYEPGDVAMIRVPGLDERRATWATSCPKENHPSGPHWHIADRNTFLPATAHGLTARPLVVIDPEDRKQVERLWTLYFETATRDSVDAMQAALREFANPNPPKPEEPTGLGAVVEDAAGVLWTRVGGDVIPQWHRADNFPKHWSNIDVVRVLSEGVTP